MSQGATIEKGRDGFTKLGRSRFLACEKGLERRDGFRRAHPFAKQVALVVDPLDQVFRLVLEKLSRGCDRLGREGGDLTRYLARFGFEMIGLDDLVDETRGVGLLGAELVPHH